MSPHTAAASKESTMTDQQQMQCSTPDPDLALNRNIAPPLTKGESSSPAFGGAPVPVGDDTNPVTGSTHSSHDDAFGA